MTEPKHPKGKRFSHVYIERGDPMNDSDRFRNRLGYFLDEQLGDVSSQIWSILNTELGAEMPPLGLYESGLRRFVVSAKMRDLLDAITLIWQYLNSYEHDSRTRARLSQLPSAETWREFVQRVLDEENVAYRLDDHGGVHYRVDEEFECNRFATIRSLGDARYRAVAEAFDAGFACLDETSPNTKGAVLGVFEALEILVKLLVGEGKVSRLGPTEIERYVRPIAAGVYEGDDPARNAANQLVTAFKGWVNAAQQYRHGPESVEPAPPPLQLAIITLSTGAAYLRWLVELDNGAGG